ncbi:MAG: hypothetical protein R6U40_07990, partial [Desulfobacterales bacterium]
AEKNISLAEHAEAAEKVNVLFFGSAEKQKNLNSVISVNSSEAGESPIISQSAQSAQRSQSLSFVTL